MQSNSQSHSVFRCRRLFRFLPLLIAPLVLTAGLRADRDLPTHLQLKQFPGSLIEEVIVPHPGELFSLMDKLPGQADWAGRVRREFSVPSTNDRTDLALLFGTLIADGFIAVQARDAAAVRECGRSILDLSERLTLGQAVLPHSRAILEACENRDWAGVRRELDRTHLTVRMTMEKMRDEDLAHYVSMAGWIRGTEILTAMISESYSEDRAEVLRQPDLAAHFIRQLTRRTTAQEDETLRLMLTGLKRIERLMDEAAASSLPSNTVVQIHEICSRIVAEINPD